jgi:isopentenyldiphosphate isomerase
MAPEYERLEFLLCVDHQGNAVTTPEKILKDFHETVARYPSFGSWFREAKLAECDEPVLLVARWLCHLVGFRHVTVHAFIDHPTLTDHTLVQVRGVDKAESPGCFDLPMAGHVVGLELVEKTLFTELAEELRLERDALCGLTRLGSYEYRQPPGQPSFRNAEYRVVFWSRLITDAWLKVSAADDEVAAIAAFSLAELEGMLARFPERIASGLKASFPLYLEHKA